MNHWRMRVGRLHGLLLLGLAALFGGDSRLSRVRGYGQVHVEHAAPLEAVASYMVPLPHHLRWHTKVVRYTLHRVSLADPVSCGAMRIRHDIFFGGVLTRKDRNDQLLAGLQ